MSRKVSPACSARYQQTLKIDKHPSNMWCCHVRGTKMMLYKATLREMDSDFMCGGLPHMCNSAPGRVQLIFALFYLKGIGIRRTELPV